MTRGNKCVSCLHCEMCRWIDKVKQDGCDFYAEACIKPCDMVTMIHERGGLIRFMFSDGLIKDVRMFKAPEKAIPTNGDVIQSMFPDGEVYSYNEVNQITYIYNHVKMVFDYGWWHRPFMGCEDKIETYMEE